MKELILRWFKRHKKRVYEIHSYTIFNTDVTSELDMLVKDLGATHETKM